MMDPTHNGGPPLDDDKIASGWVKIYRDIRRHPIVGFGQPVKPADPKRGSYSRGEAFQDLIMEAQYETSRILISGEMVALGIGQLIAARTYLAARWNWTEKTVRSFLDLLVSDGMVKKGQPNGQLGASSAKRAPNVLTICKYDIYQAYKQAITDYVETVKEPAEGPTNGQLGANWGPTKGQNLRTKEVKKEDKDSTRERDEFRVDEATADEFHRICSTWGQKPGAILFGQLTRDDTDKLLGGEIKAVAAQHPEAPPRILHAALLAAVNTLTAKALDVPSGPSKGRGTGSAASYFRQAFGSEVGRMMRADVNLEAQARADHHVHKLNLERRINGTPRPSAGGWAAAMAATEAS